VWGRLSRQRGLGLRVFHRMVGVVLDLQGFARFSWRLGHSMFVLSEPSFPHRPPSLSIRSWGRSTLALPFLLQQQLLGWHRLFPAAATGRTSSYRCDTTDLVRCTPPLPRQLVRGIESAELCLQNCSWSDISGMIILRASCGQVMIPLQQDACLGPMCPS
jgi:hypothetical protein